MDVELVRAICNVQPRERCRINTGMFKKLCKSGNVDIAKEVIKFVDLDVGCIKTLPLHIAIATNDIAIVDVVLDAGANINFKAEKGGPPPTARGSLPYKYPIEVAMAKGDAMMNHFIERGAQLPHMSRWPHQRKVYNKLRDVLYKRDIADAVPTWQEFQKMSETQRLAL